MVKSRNTKYDKTYKYLINMINNTLSVGDKLPPEQEIASALDINRMTVAKVMANLNGEGLIQRRRGSGTTLIKKPYNRGADTIVVLSPSPLRISEAAEFHDYYGELLKSIQYECLTRNFLMLCIPCQNINGGPVNLDELDSFYDSQCTKGIIVANSYFNAHEQALKALTGKNCPVVWAGFPGEKVHDLNTVNTDNTLAAKELVNELIDYGCRKLLTVSFSPNTYTRQSRIDGIRQALAAHDIPVDERYILSGSEFASSEECGRECAGLFAARKLDIDGLIILDYPIYHGFIDFCRELGLDYVKDLPTVAFDCQPNYSKSLIATALQPVEQIGTEAINIICTNLEKKNPYAIHKLLPAQITRSVNKQLAMEVNY